jgi:hypothetical protein
MWNCVNVNKGRKMKFHLLISLLMLVGSLSAQNFKSVNVTYKLNGKDASNTIHIPQYSTDYQLPIRGVMQNVGGPLKQFAHDNQVAMFSKLDQGRGFSEALLAAAAKAANRPEIEFAGAIVQGISKGGRDAADWASANQERAIAVILDHTAIHRLDYPKRVNGVPMFFNATYADMYQGIDRRKLHHWWCSMAYKAKQPCTSIIDHVKNGGHGGRGSTDLTAIWLDEAMAYRVPVNVPVGKSYKLIDVDPTKVGGYVSATLAMDGKRSYHDKVKITLKSGGANWWMPGPKTAAKYLEWVKKNGGSVVKDDSAGIKNFPIFIDLPPDLNRAVGLIKGKMWSQAFAALKKAKNPESQITKMLIKMVSSNLEEHLSLINKLDSAGDIYSVFMMIKTGSRMYKGIPAYDEKLQHYAAFFQDKKNAAKLKLGRDFHGIIDRINKTKKLNTFNLAPLKNFAAKYGETSYGKAAQAAFDKLSADLSVKLSPQSYFIN